MEIPSFVSNTKLRSASQRTHFFLAQTLLLLFSIATSSAQFLSVSFEDSPGDHVGEIDLRAMTLTFDPLTGDYQVLFESDPAAPFNGAYLIGINLFNPDLETRAVDPSYFHVDIEVLNQDCPGRLFEIRGTESRLRAWSEGDRIVAGGPEPLGLPDGFFILQTGLASFVNPTQANELIGDGQVSIIQSATGFLDPHNPPNAEDDHFALPEDSINQILNVTNNDCSPTDLHSDLTISEITQAPVHGQAELRDGELVYTPNTNYFGPDEIQYRITDSMGASSNATVSLTITSVNDPPIASDDRFVIDGRSPRNELDVLDNDTSAPDPDEKLSIIRWVADPTLGSITLENDLLIFEPLEPIRGEVQFTYTIGDGNGAFDVGIVTIQGSFENSDPIAVDDFISGQEDTTIVIDALSNDSSGPDTGEILAIRTAEVSHEGVRPVIIDNQIHYQPPADFFGVDVFQYEISDGFGGTSRATIQVTVENTNDAPTVVADLYDMIGDGTPYFFQPLLNDLSAPDPPETLVLQEIIATAPELNLTLDNNKVRAVANPGTVGVFQFDYTATDEGGMNAKGTATITVRLANFPPIAVADAIRIDADAVAIPIPVLINDTTAPDLDETLTITSVSGAGSPGSQASHNGTHVIFTPSEGFESGWVRYAISDGNGGEDSALVIITASPVLDSPAANHDFATLLEDQSTVVDVLKNDLLSEEFAESTTLKLINGPLHGTASIDPLRRVQYRPNENYTGRDSIHYLLTYPTGTSSAAELVIEIRNTNDPPIATDDRFEMLEDSGPITLNVLLNDSSGPDEDEALVVTAPGSTSVGTIIQQPDQTLLYQPKENYTGRDQFIYSVRDEAGAFATANVEIEILSVNDPPLARPDQVEIAEDISETSIDVVANDSSFPDVDEELVVFAVTQGRFGGSVRIEDNLVFYSPPQSPIREDQFSYSISDGNGGASVASVSVTLEVVDRAPVGRPDRFEIPEDTDDFALDLLANDESGSASAPNLQIGTIEGLTHPGTLTREPDGLIFTVEPNFFGTVEFQYTLREGEFETTPIPVTIQVFSVNDPPMASNDFLVLRDPEEPVSIDVLANDSWDPDPPETLTLTGVEIISGPGTVSILNNELLYVPTPHFAGNVSVRYDIEDGNSGTAEARLEIEISRTDRTAPEVSCQDIARELPTDGRLIIHPSELDAGTFDDSGEFTLSMDKTEFGISDLGRNEVFLQAIDPSGNISQCTAIITLSPPPQALELLTPRPYSVLPVSPDFGFSAADVPVEIAITGDIQQISIEGDGQLLTTIEVPDGTETVTWLWEEVIWGDHEIVVTGEDLATGRLNRAASVFSVSELASNAALVVSSVEPEDSANLFRDYLFEMGVNLEVFHEPLTPDFADPPWDVVLYYRPENGSLEDQTIRSLETLNQRGVGTYFIGRGIGLIQADNPSLSDNWDQLRLLKTSTQPPITALIDPFAESEAFVAGRFGIVAPFALPEVGVGEFTTLQSHPLISIEGNPVSAWNESPITAQTPSIRSLVQLFSVAEAGADSSLKILFQNSVCWLLKNCVSCDNANLPPALEETIPDVLVNQPFSVFLRLENNGECEISAAQISLDGAGVDALSILVDERPTPIQFDAVGQRWVSRIGRVGKGSVAARQVEVIVRVTDPTIDQIEFTTTSNNSEPIAVAANVHVSSFKLRETLDRGLILQIQGRPEQLFRVEETPDLNSNIRWRRTADRLRANSRGIAEIPVQPNESAKFYRVSILNP